jgi:hypothetical protein
MALRPGDASCCSVRPSCSSVVVLLTSESYRQAQQDALSAALDHHQAVQVWRIRQTRVVCTLTGCGKFVGARRGEIRKGASGRRSKGGGGEVTIECFATKRVAGGEISTKGHPGGGGSSDAAGITLWTAGLDKRQKL